MRFELSSLGDTYSRVSPLKCSWLTEVSCIYVNDGNHTKYTCTVFFEYLEKVTILLKKVTVKFRFCLVMKKLDHDGVLKTNTCIE